MQNQTNLSTYRLWAPVYDALLGAFFLPGRRRAMEMAELRAGENVLLVGVGTDITRRLEDIAEAAGCTIVSNEPSLLGGQYRVAVLRHAGKN